MMRELVGGQGCGADGSSGAANPLSRLLQDGAAARARGDQLQRFQAAGGGQLQGMMGPAMIGGSSEEAMAAQFHHEMMAQEMMAAQHAEHVVMMGMPGPPGEGAFLHAGFAGEQWGDDFAAGPPVAGPAMHAQWAEEMAMQRSHAGAARTAAMRQGPMMGVAPPMMMMKGRMGPSMMGMMGMGYGMMGGPRRMGAMGMHPMMQRGVNGSPAQRAAGGVGDLAGAMGDMKLQEEEAAAGAAWGQRFAPGKAKDGEEAEAGVRGGEGADEAKEKEGTEHGGWEQEFAEGARGWAEEFAAGGREMGMSKALEEVLNGDPSLAETELRDFVAAVNDGTFRFDQGAVFDDDGGVWAPADLEDAASARRYTFQTDNSFLAREGNFRAGVDLLQAGKVSEAVLALEAAVQQEPESSDAWLTLGLAHAENDEDVKAIVALNRAVEADPTSLDALLALGVSHTNELEQANALTHLRTWITKHPEYAALCPRGEAAPRDSESLHSTHALQREVAGIFLRVVQLRPDDAELHTVLGVLYNLSYEYGKAVEHFKEALRVSPEDYTLWNKLGATLANSMRSDEAIDAYIQGLGIKPNYVRALANLAISYSNQEMYEEAATCYLKALSLNPDATHLWSSLRVVCNCLDRPDLAARCDARAVEAFRPDFDF